MTPFDLDRVRSHLERATAALAVPGDPEQARVALWQEAVALQLALMGEDPGREGLRDTPARVVRYWQEALSGYAVDPAAILARSFEETEGYDELVLVRDIAFDSTCEHHLLPFRGTAAVGYVPSQMPQGRVLGLSKLVRLVRCYSARLQLQERMTRQIAAALWEHLRPLGVGVVIRAAHGCMECRGVRANGANAVTSAMMGVFRQDPSARAELLALCGAAP